MGPISVRGNLYICVFGVYCGRGRGSGGNGLHPANTHSTPMTGNKTFDIQFSRRLHDVHFSVLLQSIGTRSLLCNHFIPVVGLEISNKLEGNLLLTYLSILTF